MAILQAHLDVHWGVGKVKLTYLPVGFGSHHWLATEPKTGKTWFVTADDRAGDHVERVHLAQALGAAVSLHRDAGLTFVVAPILSQSGEAIAWIESTNWAVSIYPRLELVHSAFGGFPAGPRRDEAQRLVAQVHRATASIDVTSVPVFDFAVSYRERLFEVLGDPAFDWETGSIGPRTGALLESFRGPIERGFAHYDRLAAELNHNREGWVITHGEPHAGNMVTQVDDGRLVMVDWDTTALAPPERDLWQLMDDDGDPGTAVAAYLAELGPSPGWSPGPQALDLFRLSWDLDEVAVYTQWYSHPHENTEDMRTGWDGLAGSIENLARRFQVEE